MPAHKFDIHFTGPSNAGLRKKLREAVNAVMPACGAVREQAVLGVGSKVALTGLGQALLLLVAADYKAVGGAYDSRCSCDSCAAVSLDNASARRF